VESVIERITRGHFWDFHGGIHPPQQKEITSSKPIKQLALPKQLIIPLQQHIGREGDLLVSVGDEVLKGQALTASTNPMVVPIHAPTSGTITGIKHSVIAHPSGLSQLCIFLDVDGEDKWRERHVCSDLSTLTNHQIIEKIADAGISGMGGAGFPTHIKANSKPDINFLIINGVECEPYITSDDLLMMEHSNGIVDGIKILDKLLNPAFILIAVEDNKPKAIKALQNATTDIEKIKVCSVPTKYPAGGEKQLIQMLTGQEVASGTLPINNGIVMQNVATCFAINEAVRHDTPLIKRVVTVTGQALAKPQNVWALLGTPVNFLLEQCALQPRENVKQPVIMGGPMMGFSVASDLVPIIKTSNCILAPSQKEMPSAFDNQSKEVECIRCGQCSDVCPSQLLPQELQWSAKAKDYPQLEKLNLSDCIECGACAYVCPSQIPLVHYYRIAKAEIRQQQQLDLKAEKAKVRFEARKLRLEKEKIARQEKHKKAAAARKAAMNKSTPEATGAKSAVAAALARVKAKKAAKDDSSDNNTAEHNQTVNEATTSVADDQKSQVDAAIARAKAKKKLKSDKSSLATPEKSTEQATTSSAKPATNNESPADAKKAKIAAAIAKAKAKKLNKGDEPAEQKNEPEALAENTKAINTDKASSSDKDNSTGNTSSPSHNDKKAKVAAAVAKAKEKAKIKAQSATQKESLPNDDNTIKEIDASEVSQIANTDDANTGDTTDKKAKIAAAIAKAKAKKLAKDNKSSQEVLDNKCSSKNNDETTKQTNEST